jgi:hypothetical protein
MPEKIDAKTSDIAFDAMCVWEWVLENKDDIPELREQFEQLGTCQMRERSLTVLPELREAFERAKENGYEDCFDWEFVPWFMTHVVRFEDFGWVCATMEEAMPEGRPPKPEWEKEAEASIKASTLEQPPDPEMSPTPAPQEGDRDVFVLFCRMLGKDEPTGTIHEDDKPPAWDTYDTEREAQLEILDVIEEHIRQFRAGEREFDEIDFDSFYPVPATLHADGTLSTEDGDYGLPEQ